MAGLLFTPFNCQCCHHPSSPLLPARASFTPRRMHMLPAVRFSGDPFRQKRTRGLTLVAGAGPSSSSYAFAFVFPLSLLAATIFASIRISDKLDRDFLEELAINQAAREADEGEDPDTSLEEEPVLPRTRNRPKREA
ncbi:uncharacterized protein LOC116188309 isoform X1 [Punica granatum]|uniref:High chlorophyll fluorescence 153 n=2 Tax=Punica granatum TaxID=22663 RepID=A0A218X0C3_PUNGR|nr:uncharacterized protein LOC116188309 isoform X1 [Punica granatum]OWM78424.1 hypothetical protein CDL15_Pgr016148 [Punica granatum]PKI62984.1 hypothetical protein CRG98_016623 [Punica granatum]